LSTYFTPRWSTMMKPTAMPPTLELLITHGRCSSGLPVRLGPLRISSRPSERTPIRLVNQVESGTSSSELVPAARLTRRICIQRSSRACQTPSKW
jgi:hypothetical protein